MHLAKRFSLVLIVALFAMGMAACTGGPDGPVSFVVEYPIDVPSEPVEFIAGYSSRYIRPLSLTRGPGINNTNLLNGFSSNGWDRPNGSLEVAIQDGMYYQFGFIVTEGVEASLSSLDVWVRRSALTAPTQGEIHVSLDNFATPGIKVADFTYFGRVSGTAPAVDPTQDDPYYYMKNDLPGRPNTADAIGDPIPTVDLSKFDELQDIPSGTTVTFRLYAWGDDRVTPTNTFALGRVQGPKIQGIVKSAQD